MARSLFKRGADFVTSLVFMFASTNLVFELGLVLVVLMGWQFAAAEYVGGVAMVVLLALLGGLWFRGGSVREARRKLLAHDMSGDIEGLHTEQRFEDLTLWKRLRSGDGWTDAAKYAISDLKMLRFELLIGYAVAGFLTVMVPARAWSVVFLRGHGPWTLLENVVVAPVIAMLSFVCSIGNVPLAAALWHGGIAFGAVITFLFADLITVPLLLVYRRFYGTRMMVRMLLLFWAVMAAAGLMTQGLFSVLDLEPTSRSSLIAPIHVGWNYTAYLDVVALAALLTLFVLYRRPQTVGIGRALDPVCGMFLEVSTAPARIEAAEGSYYFCSDRCKRSFEEGARSVSASRATGVWSLL
jgi:uncharacterized membrane protein YraQ (UPF0718 family)/YHS domain-containing protein